jgi:putative transposase
LTSPAERQEVLAYIDLALAEMVCLSTVCRYLDLLPRTIQNWRQIGLTDRRKGSKKTVDGKFTPEDEDRLYQVANTDRFANSTPRQIVAKLLEEGSYYGSPSTLYRILRSRNALKHRQESKKPSPSKGPNRIPVTGPDQAWSWDITFLKTDVRGLFLFAYVIIDVYSRKIVGWTLEDHESDACAHALFRRVLRGRQIKPVFIHADNGNPMRGATLGVLLDDLGVTRSYSRPRQSNDNAVIESWFKTLKYSVSYPAHFKNIAEARVWFSGFADGYNNRHMHSGLAYVTPEEAHNGVAFHIYDRRNETLEQARLANPGRWKQGKTMVYGHPAITSFYRPLEKAS